MIVGRVGHMDKTAGYVEDAVIWKACDPSGVDAFGPTEAAAVQALEAEMARGRAAEETQRIRFEAKGNLEKRVAALEALLHERGIN